MVRKPSTTTICGILAAVLAAALAMPSVAGATTTTTVPTSAAERRAVETLYAAAKKEGTIRLYTIGADVQMTPAIAGFQKRYPGVRVKYTSLVTTDLIQRFSAEAAAKVNAADILQIADTAFVRDAIDKSWLVPLDKAKLPGGFPGTFPKKWVLAGGAFGAMTMAPSGFAYNSRLVSADDAPSTYEELLNPKWKGKIISSAPPTAGAAFWDFWDFIEKTYGPSYLTKFRDQKPIWYQGSNVAAQAHAAGEAALLVPAFASLTGRLKAGRAPVEMVVPDRTSGVTWVALPTVKAPHPNAARLFVYDQYQKPAADSLANQPGFVSPWGGGVGRGPTTFVPADSVGASKEPRKQELAKLLGLKY